jgi:site-specific DNA recombinase
MRSLLSHPTSTGNVYVGRQRVRPARMRRSATHPMGKPTAGRDPASPEDWTFVTTIPALVSQADFDEVQAQWGRNQQRASLHNKAQASLLRALVSCGQGPSACTALTSSKGHSYYRCWRSTRRLDAPPDSRCQARYSPADQLDALVWQDLCDLLAHPESIAYALERAHGGHWLPQELQARKETLRHAQAALAHQLDRLTEAYLIEVIPLAEYQRRRQELEQKQQALAAQEKQLEAQVDRQGEIAGMVTSIEAFGSVAISHLSHLGYDLPLRTTVNREGDRRWRSASRGRISPRISFSWASVGMWRTH